MKKVLLLAVFAMVLAGCATTGNITPQYVNPANYQQHDCQTLQAEVARIGKLADDTKKQNLPLATGVGIGIAGGRGGIYPTISIGTGVGGGQRQAKINTLARLYGEHDAMVMMARQKRCAFASGIKVYGE
ncbi:MAG: hypothetical protein Q4A69_06650 [Moraxella sp.]|nr:hypothetical protein [Moraxella sp.]